MFSCIPVPQLRLKRNTVIINYRIISITFIFNAVIFLSIHQPSCCFNIVLFLEKDNFSPFKRRRERIKENQSKKEGDREKMSYLGLIYQLNESRKCTPLTQHTWNVCFCQSVTSSGVYTFYIEIR